MWPSGEGNGLQIRGESPSRVRISSSAQKKLRNMNYIEIQSLERPFVLRPGEKVSFRLNNGITYEGTITSKSNGKSYYITIFPRHNAKIFEDLGLNKYSFVEEIVGYSTRGTWPEVKTLEDLGKVLDALAKVTKPVEELEGLEETEEEKLPGEWDWLGI